MDACNFQVWHHPPAEQTGPSTFRTRAFLPNNSPLPWADGDPQPTRRLAIAAAAVQACRQLHQVILHHPNS